MKQELLPCPFCGKRAELVAHGRNGNYEHYVQCRNCCIWTIELTSEDNVIALWNTRANRTIPIPEIELQAIIDRNEERKRVKEQMYERPYTVEYDDDINDEGCGKSWPRALCSSQKIFSTFKYSLNHYVCDFSETGTNHETAEGVAFCCNDTPENDIDDLLAMIEDLSEALALANVRYSPIDE